MITKLNFTKLLVKFASSKSKFKCNKFTELKEKSKYFCKSQLQNVRLYKNKNDIVFTQMFAK